MTFSAQGLVHRTTVTGTRGMVAAAHPLAALAGLRILMQGGNAIDAAVATAAALNVVEPYMSGIAGVGYMHIYSAQQRAHKVLDYCGVSPKAADLSMIDDPKKHYRGPLASLVPGACAGWLEALQRYGRMDAATVFAPAIEYAELGFALTVKNAEFIESNVEDLLEYPAAAAAYLINGRGPRPGEILRQPDLARTLRMVAAGGAEVFYRGELAEQMTSHLAALGGWITRDDLAAYQPEWVDPIQINYRGYQVFAPPPPCQAVQYLETLNIMAGFDVADMGHNSAATLHRFIEAAKLASADRAEYTMQAKPPTAGLLSPEFAAARRAQIGARAQPTGGERYTTRKMPGEIVAGNPHGWMKTECTTHFDTIDAQGNAVSVTQSLGHGFGSAVVIPGTGMAMNSFMYWFDLEPSSPNALGPGRKVEMCLSPVQVWDKAGLRLLIGTPGSYGILQTTPQMIMNVLDHGMNVQAAIEAARVKATTPGYLVDAENRIPAQVLAELEQMGHEINRLEAYSPFVGGGQGIMVDPESDAFMGGADPRRDGYALGW
jgi:gamma-glutamyltranspeptidase/glutathione hydrolase